MDSKLLLVNAITLLYRESQINVGADGSGQLVKEIVESIKIPDSSVEGDRERETIISLRATALWMANNIPNYDYERALLLQRIRVNTGYNNDLFDAFEAGMHDLETDEEIQRVCLEYRESLRMYLGRNKIKEIVKKASQQLLFNEDQVEWKNYVGDLYAQLEPYTRSMTSETNKSSMDVVDFNNLEELKAMFKRASEEVSTNGILHTGWQGINDMTGEHQGFRRGEFVLVGALQFNYKTGFTLNLFKQMALYNKPYLRDPTKKPMLVHLSLENNLTDNLIWLYVSLKENETGQLVDVNDIDVDEATNYVKEKLFANGYHIHMCRENPSTFTYYDLFDKIDTLESQGYEVCAVVCDYLNMMTKQGCVGMGAGGDEIRDLR